MDLFVEKPHTKNWPYTPQCLEQVENAVIVRDLRKQQNWTQFLKAVVHI